jgi:hypothetical protein
MSVSAELYLVIAVAALVPLLLGVRVVRRSGRRRVGATPHCGRCEYDLTANVSAVCPECGLDLTVANVRRGARAPHRGQLALGVALVAVGLFLGGAFGARFVGTYDWYRLRPTGWLIGDAGARDPATGGRAWAELVRRRGAGGLSEEDEARLTRFALDEQANARQANPAKSKSPILQELLDYLGMRAVAGKLDEGQTRQFFESTITPRVRVRRVVRAGDKYPVEMSATGAGPNAGEWWVGYANESITVGGTSEREGDGGGSSSGFGGSGSTTFTFKGRAAGEYPVVVRRTLRAYHGPHGEVRNSRLVHEWTVTAADTLHVVKPEPPGTFEVVDAPELAAQVRAAISVTQFGVRRTADGRNTVDLSIRLNAPPENVAFEVSARADGREYPLGSVYVVKGGQTSWAVGADKLRDVTADKVDFVFRASERVARGTVDLFGMWNGEVVIEGVAFSRPATRPATVPTRRE